MLHEQKKRFFTSENKDVPAAQHLKTSLHLNNAGTQYMLCLVIFNDLRGKIRRTCISTKNLV